MRIRHRQAAALAITAGALVAANAPAGPDWEEGNLGSGDAGSLTPDAQVPFGKPPGSALEKLSGQFGDGLLTGPADLQDLFLVEIVDPANFSLIANPPVSKTAGTTNVQVWLFDASGLGVLGSDGVGDGADFCSPTTGACNAADDGTGVVVTAAGHYYVGISLFDSDPLSVSSLPIFSQTASDEVSGPDGAGGSTPLGSWTVAAAGSGPWTIFLEGCAYVQCQGDANLDGLIDIDDIVAVVLVFGSTANPDEDLDGDGVVDVDDIVEVVLNFGVCNPV